MALKFHAIFAVAALGCYLGADYTIASRQQPEAQPLTVRDYLGGWIGFLTTGASPAPGLAGMLPEAPPGWTRRPAGAGDAAALLGVPGSAPAIATVGGPAADPALTLAAATYERGPLRVVIEAARLPDALFSDAAATAARMQAETWVLAQSAGLMGRVGGLDIHRTPPVPGLGARLAVASVGGQVQVRIAYPEAMDEAALLALLRGLDVAAMNAGVVTPDPAIAAAGVAAPGAPAADGGGMAGFLGAAAAALGSVGSMVGMGTASPDPVDLRDPAAVQAAIRSGNTAGIHMAAQAEFNAIAAALETSDSRTGTGIPGAASGRQGTRPGKIKVGVGTCGERAGAGKFCSVRD
jgi:hypothetical protein